MSDLPSDRDVDSALTRVKARLLEQFRQRAAWDRLPLRTRIWRTITFRRYHV